MYVRLHERSVFPVNREALLKFVHEYERLIIGLSSVKFGITQHHVVMIRSKIVYDWMVGIGVLQKTTPFPS